MALNRPEVTVRRPVYQQAEINRAYEYSKPKTVLSRTVSKKFQRFDLYSFARKSIPILDWLPKYEWKNNILGDIVAGITVAVMHIPQGMAYAILGNVPPVVGIYMAFFPVLVYLIFGTSRHNSMGAFAVVCMMTGKTVLMHSSMSNDTMDVTQDGDDAFSESHRYSPTEVATAITFTVALIQLGMYILRLGVISTLLSDTLVSGFTTAAAIHVLSSQLKDIFGLHIQKRKGIFKVVFTYIDLFNNIDNLNVAATIISLITMIITIFNNEVLKPRISTICIIPIPIEMLAVVVGTLVSTQMNLTEVYNIATVGHIPLGLPQPAIPPLSLITDVLLDSFVITMVSYTISMSMALIFAQKMDYEVDSNQELAAQGLGNLVGSFFSCMPFAASLSRSSIQQSVGGYSQLASLISCSLLLCVLLWVGPFFEPLPRCILASIIVVALKGMLLQIKDFIRFWKLSKVDAGVWMVTFVTVVLLDIEYGLLAGICLSLTSLLALSMKPYSCTLALVPGTELYLDDKRYKGVTEIPGVRILHYCGGLNFASRHHFRNEVYKAAGVVPQKELLRRQKLIRKKAAPEGDTKKGNVNEGFEGHTKLTEQSPIVSLRFEALILDFSSLVYIDPSGVSTLRTLVHEYDRIGINVYLTGCSGPVFETIRKCNIAECKEDQFTMFPTVGDAVNFARYDSSLSLTPICMICPREEPPEESCMSRL